MFVVISKWEFDAAHESEVAASGEKMMAAISSWPAVASAFNVRIGDSHMISVIEYTDQASYERLVQDPNSPFEKAAAEHGIEQHARWLWSERGEKVEN